MRREFGKQYDGAQVKFNAKNATKISSTHYTYMCIYNTMALDLTYIRGEADRAQFHPCAAGTGGCVRDGARAAGRRDELAVQFEQRPLLRGVVVVIGGARSDGDEHGWVAYRSFPFQTAFVFYVHHGFAVPAPPIILFVRLHRSSFFFN